MNNVRIIGYRPVMENGKMRFAIKYAYAITAAPYKLREKYRASKPV